MKTLPCRSIPLAIVIFILSFWTLTALGYSGGPDASYTGAPGDINTCIACHTPSVSFPAGSVSLTGVPAVYTPGATYGLTVTVNDSRTGSRFGFQLTALRGTTTQAGNLANTTTNTQLKANGVLSRQYIQQNLWIASSAIKTWSFNWTAPAAPVGPINFYVAALRGNNNANTNLDTTYTTNRTSVAPPPPAHDNFANAQILTGNSVKLTNSTANATKESGETNHAGNAGGASVWYRWTAPSNGIVILDTKGSLFDTLLGVYTGSVVSSLTHIASDDQSGGSNTSALSFPATAATIYRIAVDGYNGASGTNVLNLSLLPFPSLSISRTSTNTVLISWPVSPPGFILEFVASLPASNNWLVVTNTVITVGDQRRVTHEIPGFTRFFRLRAP